MDLKPFRPFKVPDEVSIYSQPTQELPWAVRDPSLRGKEGLSVFAETLRGVVRVDVWDTRFHLFDKLRRKRAAAVAGYIATLPYCKINSNP